MECAKSLRPPFLFSTYHFSLTENFLHPHNAFVSGPESDWGPWRARRSLIPTAVASWLLDESSLTRRLQRTCIGRFHVRLLRQEWQKPPVGEHRLLGMRRGQLAVVREVELLCDSVPWVFARSLIPSSSMTGRAKRLAYLGEKPLGALLFADPGLRRRFAQTGCLTPRHPLYAAATNHLIEKPARLWGRRTLYFYSEKPLLVYEIFLPDIPLSNECP